MLVWGHMEIALVSQNSLRIKGKQGIIVVNPTPKTVDFNASLILDQTEASRDEYLQIYGAGEFEVAGIKITGTRAENRTVFSMNIDGIEILIGHPVALEKIHAKLKEHHIVIVAVDSVGDISYVTNFAPRVVVLYGESALVVGEKMAKETLRKESKISYTLDKLPLELEVVTLQ